LIAGVHFTGPVQTYVQNKLGLAMAGRVLLSQGGFSTPAVEMGVEIDIEANWIDAVRVARLIFQRGKRQRQPVIIRWATFGGAN
jgi:hypothetical protein